MLSDCRVLTTPRLTACYTPATCHRCTAAMRCLPHATVVPQLCVAHRHATSAARRSAEIVYIRNSKKGRFYTCIFIENGLQTALRTYIFMKKSVFVCTFSADRGKIGRNAHIKSMKMPFSYVRLTQTGMSHLSSATIPRKRPRGTRHSTPPTPQTATVPVAPRRAHKKHHQKHHQHRPPKTTHEKGPPEGSPLNVQTVPSDQGR